MSRSILVTGGAGYIGSHTCKLLAASGFEPVAYDNLSTGHAELVRWGPLVEGDIRDSRLLAETLRSRRPAAIIHFAAKAYVGESVEDPSKYYNNNVLGSLSLLDACLATGMDNLVFSSTCATYGIPKGLPIKEDFVQEPVNPYGRSKLIVERMIEDFSKAYGLRYLILRYFNASGADPDGELNERHEPETHLIPRALQSAAGDLPYLQIFGDDYETQDGTCVRDYIHVADLARAHVLAVQHLLNGGDSFAVNLGAGRPTSILQILDAIQRITKHTVPTVFEARRPGDPPALVADIEAARERLGFIPELSDIETILRTAAPTFRLPVVAA
jgi:UDP-arabinose 4-epimerase